MGISNRIFNGKMNLDASPYRVQPTDYIDALNITIDAQGEGRDKVVSNINGNTLVPYTLPTGQNKSIGRYEDIVRNRVYDFIWNSNGNHLVRFFNPATNTITTLIEDLTDTNNVPVLDFNPSKRVNHVDIIYRDTNEGDLIFWTDGNTSPKKMNVLKIQNGDYSVIKASFIETAKAPFLSSPLASYGSDTTRNANALRRKLFQFTARPVYDDYEKATFSTYSKIPLPVGFYGSDNDIDSTKNNFISVTVETGDENVIEIEIAMRNNINNAWGDFVLIAVLNKAQLNIPDNAVIDYLFYNDQIYPPIDPLVATQLYDWVPQLADAQCLGNGTTPIYGAITENYNNYPIEDLDVVITASNITNVPPDTDPPTLVYSTNGTTWTFLVGGTIPTGTVFKIIANIGGGVGATLFADYTSLIGDDAAAVATGLCAYITANFPGYLDGVPPVPRFFVLPPVPGFYVLGIQVTVLPGGGTISTEKTWMWNANYIFGLVYVDDQNRDMPGVTTFTDPINTSNDFMVTTPTMSLSGSDVQTPVLEASINHEPPAGSKAYYWVRRRQTYGTFMMYMTCDLQEDTDFYYFCLANIEQYKTDNSQFIYDTAPITTESRVQVLAGVTAGVYDGDLWTQDYQILGTVTRTLTGGISPDNDKLFIKVKKPDAAVSPAYSANMLLMVYTPALNPTDIADSVYWEWGEGYEIYTLYTLNYNNLSGAFTTTETVTGSTSGATGQVFFDSGGFMYVENVEGRFDAGETITGGTSLATATITTITSQDYHRGGDQDQTPFQEALFTWPEGDVYFHQRVMSTELLTEPYATATLNIMDANYSDFFNSEVNDNGRAQAIEVNARQQYNPVLVRFGGELQAGTNINQTNNFKFDNFDEYDRGFADIRKLFIDKRYMYVFQRFDIGIVPIFTQIIKDTSGNPLEANSDQLLNKIMYPYQGKFGIGDAPESFAFGKGAKYGVDTNKGVVWRLSQDGITPLSILYECNAFFVSNLAAFGKGLDNGIAAPGETYAGNPSVIGVFDAYTNKYIVALEEINRYNESQELTFHQDAYTLNFLETRDSSEGFESKYSFHPEMMGCLNNLLITYKDGELWRHDDALFANFYGVQYEAYIVAVFNDNPTEKKSFNAIAEVVNSKWDCPEISTDVFSYGTTVQQSSILNGELVSLEGQYHATIKRDANSRGGKWNGSFMKGKFIIVKFRATSPSTFSLLNIATVKYNQSPLSI